MACRNDWHTPLVVAPARERGLKLLVRKKFKKKCRVAPVRERGLKLLVLCHGHKKDLRRSREGAWIEMVTVTESQVKTIVAPARERGLK